MTATDILIIEKERVRRFSFIACIGGVLLVYFYAFPLYWFLLLVVKLSPEYARVNGNLTDLASPSIDMTGLVLIFAGAAVLATIYVKPRSYLRKVDDGGVRAYHLFYDGEKKDALSMSIPTALSIERKSTRSSRYNKVSSSWRSRNNVSTVIHTVSTPEVVIYDCPRSWFSRVPKYVAKCERFFGDIRWEDNDGLIHGRHNREKTVAGQKQEQRLDRINRYLSKRARRPPKVKNLWGARIAIIIVCGGFGFGFWVIGGYRVIGGLFWGVSIIVLIDMALAMMGYGQQPRANKK